ncbi:MAG: Gfo/Idh/MocA family oxidoreductase [Spirochaetota bacterium]
MNKVSWGVIGAGGIADRRTIPGMLLSNNARLAAIMDVDEKRLAALAQKYPEAKPYPTCNDLLDDPDVDAVYIATPVFEHCKQIHAAADRGKHILIEKPIGLNANEAYAAVAYCEKKGVKFAVGLMMRYSALHVEMKKIITSNGIGAIVSAHAQFSCWYPDIPNAWRQDPALSGGGALIDLGIHSIDIIEQISGQKARSVMALTGTKSFRYKSDDSASVLLELENGAYAISESNFNIPDIVGTTPLSFFGTAGSITAERTLAQDDGGEAFLRQADPNASYDALQRTVFERGYPVTAVFGNLYAKEIESFSDSILHNNPTEVSGADGVHLQKIIDAAYKSSKNGMKIMIR